VLPGSRARIVRCGGRYDPQLVKRSSEWVSEWVLQLCCAIHYVMHCCLNSTYAADQLRHEIDSCHPLEGCNVHESHHPMSPSQLLEGWQNSWRHYAQPQCVHEVLKREHTMACQHKQEAHLSQTGRVMLPRFRNIELWSQILSFTVISRQNTQWR